MSIITIRLPRMLREKIKKYRNINWSEVVREAIARRIEIEERMEAARKIEEENEKG